MKAVIWAVVGAFVLATAGCASGDTSMDHLHTVAVIDGEVIAGSHNGMWRLHESAPPEPLSEVPWDVMGFADDGPTWFASGHPSPDMQGPANLGLQVSTDQGRSWQGRALVGDVDFHRLAAREGVLAGIDSQSGNVLVSFDEGFTWQRYSLDGARDVLVVPDGIVVLGDANWVLIDSTGPVSVPAYVPGAVTAHVGEDRILVSTMDGGLWSAVQWRGPWVNVTDIGEPALWIGSESTVVSILTHAGALISRDGGVSFVAVQQ
jgi:hypothetical protein